MNSFTKLLVVSILSLMMLGCMNIWAVGINMAIISFLLNLEIGS